MVDESETVLQSLKKSYAVEEEVEEGFGLEVLEISEAEAFAAEQDNADENTEDNTY